MTAAASVPTSPELLTVEGEDPGRDREEDGRAVEVDGHLLDPMEAAADGHQERGQDGDDHSQVADVRRGRHPADSQRDLDVPCDLPRRPGRDPEGDELADPPLGADRAMGAAHGERRREEAGEGRVGELPQRDEAADVGGGEEQQETEHRQAAEQQHPQAQPVPGGRPQACWGVRANGLASVRPSATDAPARVRDNPARRLAGDDRRRCDLHLPTVGLEAVAEYQPTVHPALRRAP